MSLKLISCRALELFIYGHSSPLFMSKITFTLHCILSTFSGSFLFFTINNLPKNKWSCKGGSNMRILTTHIWRMGKAMFSLCQFTGGMRCTPVSGPWSFLGGGTTVSGPRSLLGRYSSLWSQVPSGGEGYSWMAPRGYLGYPQPSSPPPPHRMQPVRMYGVGGVPLALRRKTFLSLEICS